MSEELLQRDLLKNPEKIGKWDFYNIGATSVKALKEYGIIRNVNYGTEEKKKVDGLIVQKKNVIAIIENKKPSEFKTKEQKNKAIKQELEVAKKLDAHILIATDTKETLWVNVLTGKLIKDESGKELKYNFDKTDEKLPELIEKIMFSINELNDQIKPKQLVNPTDLAKQIWQDIWSVSGATPENCLYTFVELFIFKYLSDLGVLQGMYNFNTLYDSFNGNTEDEVLETYASIVRPKIKTLFPENPADKTTIINGTIFVSKDQKAVKGYSTVFKKVLTKFKDYGKLEHIDYDFKSQLFESFLKESISKKNWGQFFTPLKVVRAVVEMAKDDIKVGAKICDPACGVGKFLLEPVITKLDEFYEIKKGKLIPKISIHGFDKGFEGEEQKTIILAKANMLIYFSDLLKNNPTITTEFAQLFNDSFLLKTNSILGTLSEPVENEYDLIVTNPPYVTSGSSNLKEEIKKDGTLVNYYKINAIGVEGLFMEWIIRALKPNGKAFVVVPDGIFNRQNDKNLRQFIIDECYIDGIVSLPLNTFFTTNKKTYILCLTKKANKKETQTDPVFTYLVSEMGESRDVYRFDIDQDDLSEAVTLYSFFKGNKSSFAKINTDNRCKVFPFTDFTSSLENSWIIDKWWSEEEKIELGISEKKDKLGLLEFSSLVEDVAFTIKGFQEEIKELSEKKKSKINYKIFKVKDLFTIERGKGLYIKRYIDTNKGEYPVYSGNTFGAFSHINSFDYELPCISWAIDGLAGYTMIHNEKFSATNHRGVLIPKSNLINLKYAKFILEPLFRNSKKGRIGADGSNEYTALPPFMLENIEFQMPIDENGNIDFEFQNLLVDKINFIEDIKKRIEDYKSQIKNLIIEIKTEYTTQSFKASDLFDLLPIPKKITKKDIQKGGKYPVYSSQISEYGLIGYSNLKMFETSEKDPIITFGDHTRIFYKRTNTFSVLDNVKVLKLKPDHKDVDIDFIIYNWQPLIENLGYSRHWKEAKNLSIQIPINIKGKFDIEAQKLIADKYRKIELIKKSIMDELDRISKTEIDFE
jgi:type I restriction enzyme M protein